MKNLKICLLYIAIIFFYSCGARKSSVDKTDIAIFEKKEIQRTSPGERVYISTPAETPERKRPRKEDKVYVSPGGVVNTVSFDQKGIITHIITDCPPIDERISELVRNIDKSKKKDTEKEEGVGWKGFLWSFIFGFLVGIIVWVTKPWKSMFSLSWWKDFLK